MKLKIRNKTNPWSSNRRKNRTRPAGRPSLRWDRNIPNGLNALCQLDEVFGPRISLGFRFSDASYPARYQTHNP